MLILVPDPCGLRLSRCRTDGRVPCCFSWSLIPVAPFPLQNGWNFYANEYTVPQGELGVCKQFVNLMIFRDPLSRLTSQIGWIQKLYKELFNASDISKAFK